MKKFGILLLLLGLALASVTRVAVPIEPSNIVSNHSIQKAPLAGRTLIGPVGDMRAVLGPQSMNIEVCEHGDVIAVIYGPPSDPFDANSPFSGIGVAYSLDRGTTFSTFPGISATTPPFRRIYPGLDACDNFCSTAGNVFFAWQEPPLGYATNPNEFMLDENMPSSPSFSSIYTFPDDIYGWWMCPAVNPDDNLNVLVTGWSYLLNGNLVDYCWISNDGGYTWSDTIRMITDPIGASCYNGAGHLRWGSGNYAFFTYHDTLGAALQYPHYVESTDGGNSWSAPTPLPAITQAQFWWTELTCEVINDKPYAVHIDIDAAGLPQLFYPDPSSPGSPGAWNWTAFDVSSVGTGSILFQDTTWDIQVVQYPNISYEPTHNIILVSYKCNYAITPPSASWPDGLYLGGILSTDGGVTWKPCRPMSTLYPSGVAEAAHKLVMINDTVFVYVTSTDAGDGVAGNQYFELGVVEPIDNTNWPPGVAENKVNVVPHSLFTISPTIAKGDVRASFSLPSAGNVKLDLFDITGRNIGTAFNGYLGTGEHTINLSTAGLANGVYIVSMNSASAKFIVTR